MIIDPSTNIGKVRLRVGDFGDIPWLPDSVYDATLTDTNNNLPKSAQIVAQYILGMLSQRTHRKLQQMEVWGAEAFQNYLAFLKFTLLNPNSIANVAPIPYSPEVISGKALSNFVYDWNANYAGGTQSEWMAYTAEPPRPDLPSFLVLDGWELTGEVPE